MGSNADEVPPEFATPYNAAEAHERNWASPGHHWAAEDSTEGSSPDDAYAEDFEMASPAGADAAAAAARMDQMQRQSLYDDDFELETPLATGTTFAGAASMDSDGLDGFRTTGASEAAGMARRGDMEVRRTATHTTE